MQGLNVSYINKHILQGQRRGIQPVTWRTCHNPGYSTCWDVPAVHTATERVDEGTCVNQHAHGGITAWVNTAQVSLAWMNGWNYTSIHMSQLHDMLWDTVHLRAVRTSVKPSVELNLSAHSNPFRSHTSDSHMLARYSEQHWRLFIWGSWYWLGRPTNSFFVQRSRKTVVKRNSNDGRNLRTPNY